VEERLWEKVLVRDDTREEVGCVEEVPTTVTEPDWVTVGEEERDGEREPVMVKVLLGLGVGVFNIVGRVRVMVGDTVMVMVGL